MNEARTRPKADTQHQAHYQRDGGGGLRGEADAVSAERDGAAPVAPLEGVTGPQGSPAQVGALMQALAQAAGAAGSVKKDGRNQFHRYDYATAGAVFEATQAALSSAGVSVVPLDSWADGDGLGRRYCIGHSGGGWMVVAARAWPIVVGKGQTQDKAHAAALTGSHRYFLRDLLQIPDKDDSTDFNQRQDPPQGKAGNGGHYHNRAQRVDFGNAHAAAQREGRPQRVGLNRSQL